MANTAKQIIDSILIRVGLGENTVPDPFSSPDLEIKEIINLLNDKIQSLTSEVEFTELKKIATFEVVEDETFYPFSKIAPDLKMFSPKTFNMTDKIPLTLLTDEEWLKMEMSETKTNGEYFMVLGGGISLYPGFVPNTKIKFFYYSKYAVMDKDDNKKESFTSVSDVSLLPAQILIWAVSAAWLKSKGFATALSAEAEFTKLINRYLSMNKPGELVHLSGSPLSSVKLNITPYNWEI